MLIASAIPLVTLTTDFGHKDAYVGIMKGVISGIAPGCQVVDLCHEVAPQDLVGGALTLWTAARMFPSGTIHTVVVDPGVGSERAAILVQSGGYFFVAPDNGVLSPTLTCFSDWQAVRLENTSYFRDEISSTFHGRDIFSPVAAHLATGVPFEAFGEPLTSIETMTLFDAKRLSSTKVEGRVIHFDHFGNAITNIPGEWLAGGVVSLRVADTVFGSLDTTFADCDEGGGVAYVGSSGLLEFAVRNGSAQREWGWSRDLTVEVELIGA